MTQGPWVQVPLAELIKLREAAAVNARPPAPEPSGDSTILVPLCLIGLASCVVGGAVIAVAMGLGATALTALPWGGTALATTMAIGVAVLALPRRRS